MAADTGKRALAGMEQANTLDKARLDERRYLVSEIEQAWEGLKA